MVKLIKIYKDCGYDVVTSTDLHVCTVLLTIQVTTWNIFQHVITYPKLRIWQNPFMGQEITPLDICHSNHLAAEVQSEWTYYFSVCANFWTSEIIWNVLAIVHQLLHNFYRIVLSLKNQLRGRKYDVMNQTLCRAYIDPDGPTKEKEAFKTSKAAMK